MTYLDTSILVAYPLRTLDALHLAVAATLRVRLATADHALARAAETLGIEVVTIE